MWSQGLETEAEAELVIWLFQQPVHDCFVLRDTSVEADVP